MLAHYQKQDELSGNMAVEVLVKQNFSVEQHFHSNLELNYVVEGQMIVHINGEEAVLKEGDLYFATGYEPHGFDIPDYCVCYVLSMPEHIAKSFKTYLGNKVLSTNFLYKSRESALIKKQLDSLARDHHPLTQKGYLYIILGTILDKIELVDPTVKKEPRAAGKILRYLEDNFLNDIKLDDVARAIGYSSNYTSSMFNATFNCKISEYLNSIRARHAAYLFSQGQTNVFDVAVSSGFNSIRTFNRAFRSEFEVSPREYIRQLKDQAE